MASSLISTYFSAVLHHVHTELENVPTTDLPGRALLGPFTQSLVVDESPITGLGVLEVKFPVLVPEKRVIPRENLERRSVRAEGETSKDSPCSQILHLY